jgi:hypothetical protein
MLRAATAVRASASCLRAHYGYGISTLPTSSPIQASHGWMGPIGLSNRQLTTPTTSSTTAKRRPPIPLSGDDDFEADHENVITGGRQREVEMHDLFQDDHEDSFPSTSSLSSSSMDRGVFGTPSADDYALAGAPLSASLTKDTRDPQWMAIEAQILSAVTLETV